MAATINTPQDIFAEIIDDYKNLYSDDLISITLYGSAAGKDYTPGKSDLNFLIVLSEEGIDHLERAMKTVSRWKKRNVAVPLFMTRSYIDSSLDSYPLEFLNMQNTYIHVYGIDILKNMSFNSVHLRLQCERDIKGKLLLIREGFLETEGNKKKITELIRVSITAFISIFTGILYLRGVDIPETRRDILRVAAQEIPIDERVFTQCLDIREGIGNYSPDQVQNIFKRYVKELRKLWAFVDKMDNKALIT